jgi:hypothetical protein
MSALSTASPDQQLWCLRGHAHEYGIEKPELSD